MTSRPSATGKRKYALFADTITTVEVADLTSKLASEDSCSAKRRKLAQPQAESLAPSSVCTPTSTPPPDCGSQISSLRTSNDPNPGFPDSGSKGNSADIPDLPRSGLLDSVNGADGEHDEHRLDKELLEPLRQSISPSRRMEGDRHVSPDFYVGEDKNDGGDGEVGESDEDELNCDEDEPRRASAVTFQQRKPSNRLLQESRRGPLRTGLKHQSQSTMPARTLRQPKSSPSRRHSRTQADTVTRSGSVRTSSPGTRVAHDRSIDYRQSNRVDHRVTDIALCQVPKCTTLVTAIVRCNDRTSQLSLKQLTIVHDIIGDAGQLLRMTQVTSDSWLLVGCRYNHQDAPNVRASRSWMQPRSPHGKGASYGAVDSDHEGNGDDDFEDSGENSGSERSDNSDSDVGIDDDNNDGQLYREHRRVHVRTREPWSKSDEQRLLAYKSKMDMKWNDIFCRFPDRTPGAVRARWQILQQRRNGLEGR
ncbi:hypothetical protein K469DRAFT_239852 [Zopfia rhizophila CBS 207.26]|uniref:Myb-like domain-containing protein n=1 Tax=Zopfia rhizophila CBS 207.26 TaxID=1314779 RepID=A0A6A6ERN3_9PEZI|nr:hypothetical protein K469DRAFT_239852 [Zopfia rhizophila CBS 207.26]